MFDSPVPTFPPPPRIEPPRALATAAIALAAFATAIQAVRAVIALTTDPGDGTRLSAYDAVGLVLILALLASYVVTCLWLYQARINAELITGPEDQTRGRIWVWLGWWVPIVNFWFPFQVVRDVQQVSVYAAKQKAADVGLWWAGWLAWLFFERAQARLDTPAGALEVVIAVLFGAALWRWILIVRRTTDAQIAVAEGAVAA